MTAFLSGVGTVFGIEMRQRVRGVAWYVLLGVFVILVAIVTVIVWFITTSFRENIGAAGGTVFSTIAYFVLLLGMLVAPALSGNAINGDRDAGTLATTQVTLVTSGQLVIGKFLAAWISALAFLVASVPFIVFATAIGGLHASTFFVAVPMLAIELGIVAAVGVGLSGLVQRPLFSIVLSYLFVALLSVGTVIAFVLGGLAIETPVTYSNNEAATYDDSTGIGKNCGPYSDTTYDVPRFDRFWGVLAANPYVLLADATPTTYDQNGNPTDLFGTLKAGVRSAQVAPPSVQKFDSCASPVDNQKSSKQIVDSTVPSWFVGLAIHLVLAAAALVGAWARLRTPARRLGRGSRIA